MFSRKFDSNRSWYIVLAAGILSSILGLAVIFGWLLQNSALVRIYPSFEPMRFNTALGFLVSGVALVCFSNKRVLMKPLGLIIALAGMLTFFQYVSGIDIGLDQFFVKDTVSSAYPGRMAPNTALGFSFTGVAIFLLGSGIGGSRNIVIGLLGSVTAALGLTALLGYLTGVMSINAWEDFIAMALHTAIGFIAVGLGIIVLALKDGGGRHGRALGILPVLIGVGLLTGTLVYWRALAIQEHAHINRTVELKAKAARDAIHNQLETRTQALLRMARRWESLGRPLKKAWESDAGYYVSHFKGYRALGWVDPSLNIRWMVTRGGGVGAPAGMGLDASLKDVLGASIVNRPLKLSAPVILDGEKILITGIPLDGGVEGFIIGVFDTEELFNSILPGELTGLYHVDVLKGDSMLFRINHGSSAGGKWAHKVELNLTGAAWAVKVQPTMDAMREMHARLPELTLAAGIAMSLLFSLAVHFAQASQERAKTTETANARLELEVAERKRAEEEAESHAAELAEANARLELEVIERKKAEEAVARHSAELERSNAELEQFAYVASHDLQEPLRVIAGYVQLLSKRYRGKLDSDADEFISFAVDGTNRMQLLINDLLAYSRIGSRDKASNPCDCNSIVRDTMTTLKAAMDESMATVTHDQLPTIMADQFQLRQLFQNLIGNAIKYRGKDPAIVHISSMMNGTEWVFSVKDNGIGIDPKYRERIFVIFQRLHGKGEYSGTGIGLAICKKVVENHNGKIWVDSTPENGSTFYFTIPT